MRHVTTTVYNGRPVEVAMGWDVQVEGYFMTVMPVEEDNPDANEESGCIYSNLDDPAIPFPGMMRNIEYYRKILLLKMKIEVDPAFFAKVLAD